MTDQGKPPREHIEVVEDQLERGRVRRAPKYSVFLVLGAALGVLIAAILTFAFNGSDVASPNTGLQYSPGQVFGFLALICGTAGLALGGVIALVLDRVLARRAHDVTLDHERVHTED